MSKRVQYERNPDGTIKRAYFAVDGTQRIATPDVKTIQEKKLERGPKGSKVVRGKYGEVIGVRPRTRAAPSPLQKNKKNWDRLLEIFRAQFKRTGVVNVKMAARETGIREETVRQAFAHGWPATPNGRGGGSERPWAAVPIREILQREKIMSLASLEEERVALEREKIEAERQAMQQAIEARALEGRMVKAARTIGGSLLAQSLSLAKASEPLVQRVGTQLQQLATSDNVDLRSTMNLLKDMGKFAEQSVSILDRAMQLDRRHNGEPEKMLGITSGPKTIEEALSVLAHEQSLMDRVQKALAAEGFKGHPNQLDHVIDIPTGEGAVLKNEKAADDQEVIPPPSA